MSGQCNNFQRFSSQIKYFPLLQRCQFADTARKKRLLIEFLFRGCQLLSGRRDHLPHLPA